MIIYIPFIYFLLITVYIILKKGICIAAGLSGLYTVTSLFSLLIKLNPLLAMSYMVDYSLLEIDIWPTLTYCMLISLFIYPLYKYDEYLGVNIPITFTNRPINVLCNFYIAIFLLTLLLYGPDIFSSILSGDFGDVRANAYTSEFQKKGPVQNLLSILSNGSFFMIFFFFYNLASNTHSNKYNTLLLLASLSKPLISITAADRSCTYYWIMIFVFCYLFFRKAIVNDGIRKYLRRTSIFMGSGVLIYLIAVTISRFADRDYSAQGSVILYLGQPFLNFCNYWGNLSLSSYSYHEVLPITNYLFLGNVQMGDWYEHVASTTGVHINVFGSFIGQFISGIGTVNGCLFTLFLCLLEFIIIKKRYYNQNNFFVFFCVFAVTIIPFCGCIAYYYSVLDRAICSVLILFYLLLFNPPIVYKA